MSRSDVLCFTGTLRSKEKERKRAVQEYITSEPSSIAEAMNERRRNLTLLRVSDASPLPMEMTGGSYMESSAGATAVGGKKPSNLKEILFPLARNMSIVLLKRMPIFRCVEIMKCVTEVGRDVLPSLFWTVTTPVACRNCRIPFLLF
jgi:hypothetical protein